MFSKNNVNQGNRINFSLSHYVKINQYARYTLVQPWSIVVYTDGLLSPRDQIV